MDIKSLIAAMQPAAIPNADHFRNLTSPIGPIVPVTKNAAIWMRERLMMYFHEFEEKLEDEHEIGAYCLAFGGRPFYVNDIGAHGPDLIMFYGSSEEGYPIELLQHLSQVNVLLVALPKRGEVPERYFDAVDSDAHDEDKDGDAEDVPADDE